MGLESVWTLRLHPLKLHGNHLVLQQGLHHKVAPLLGGCLGYEQEPSARKKHDTVKHLCSSPLAFKSP